MMITTFPYEGQNGLPILEVVQDIRKLLRVTTASNYGQGRPKTPNESS